MGISGPAMYQLELSNLPISSQVKKLIVLFITLLSEMGIKGGEEKNIYPPNLNLDQLENFAFAAFGLFLKQKIVV
jgi:hypothetical protein